MRGGRHPERWQTLEESPFKNVDKELLAKVRADVGAIPPGKALSQTSGPSDPGALDAQLQHRMSAPRALAF
jgi:hypothetical protein